MFLILQTIIRYPENRFKQKSYAFRLIVFYEVINITKLPYNLKAKNNKL